MSINIDWSRRTVTMNKSQTMTGRHFQEFQDDFRRILFVMPALIDLTKEATCASMIRPK